MPSYLLFSLNGVRYAIDASSVLEIIWLPELTLAEEAPPYIAGLVNLRGKIEPVMDLGMRLGHAPQRFRSSDRIVMLLTDGLVMGVIVSDVSDVVGIPASEIEPLPRYDDDRTAPVHFLAGNAKVGDEIVTLLDVARLIHEPVPSPPAVATNPKTYFCPDATDEERAIFSSRSHNLMKAAENPEDAERIPLAIIQLGEEYFGVELEMVREFSHLRRVTFIPCCPPHIVGNMNLRGDILTLVDIRGALHIAAGGSAREVMVVESGEEFIGVPVDKVLEVIYLRSADVVPLPAAHEEKNEYCKSAARYGESMVGILDMQKILAKGGLEVAEEA